MESVEKSKTAYEDNTAAMELQQESTAAALEELLMNELQEEYEKSCAKARENIETQLGLFNELDGTAKTSIDNLIGTLKGQVAYM